MRRRRINWARRILSWSFLFCFAMYIVIIITTFFINNEGRVKADLAQEMVDDQPPTIELIGGDSMTIAVGDSFMEPGFTVYDTRSIPTVEIEQLIDVRNPGEYEISYRASDADENVTEVTRKVRVIEPAGRIYLTFDDGPGDYTATLLDILAKYNIKATFFVTGYGDDALIKREYEEGHAVGLHTNSHIYSYIYSSIDNYMADLNAVKDRVYNITGKNTKMLRFPGGSSNLISANYDGGIHIMTKLSELLNEQKYAYFDWNVDSNDAGGADSSEQIYNNVISALKWGGDSVVLQHDIKPQSVEAVEKIIQYGLDNNFVFSKLRLDSFGAHHGINN